MYLPIGLLTSQDTQEFWNFPRFVSNALNTSHKSTGIEGENVLGKDYIKLNPSVVPLNTFFIAFALVKAESYQQLIKICWRSKHCNNLYVLTIGLC